MRREVITVSVAAALVVGAFFVTVAILNSTLYSASGFVHSYLDALQRRDATTALDLAGPGARTTASRALLEPEAMGELDDIEFIDQRTLADGTLSLTFNYTAEGKQSTSAFTVERSGSVLGLFPSWSFATAPFSIVQLTILHAQDATANGIDIPTSIDAAATPFVVFTPTAVNLSHETTYLRGGPLRVTATRPGASVVAVLDVQANDGFVDAVQKEVDARLDDCATQQVLLPTACPFGQQISNRTVTRPEWSIEDYPTVSLVPGPQPGSWLMRPTAASARLSVDVQSLFDGTRDTFDSDVPFTASYAVSIGDDDSLTLVEQE